MSNPPRWPYPGPGSSSRPSSPYIPSHVQSPPGRLTSPLPFMSATPPPMLIRPTATGPHHVPRHESPRPFAPPRWSPAHAKSPPPPPPPHLQFSSPRPFFRPIAPTPPPTLHSSMPTPPPPMGFPHPMHHPFVTPPPHLPPPPPFSPEMFYQMQPSYDMEYVYPPGMDPHGFSETQSMATEDDGSDGLTTAEIIASQSQDYIDEKLAEYQATIQYLQDEQERVQKKTFTNWINSYLAKHVPPLHVVDLIEDLKDGTKILGLLQVLSNEVLPVEKGKNLRRPHYLSNVNTALQFLQNKRIKLVNINATDIVDGRPAVVLGLVWTIILYFQIEENTKILTSLGYRFTQATPTRETDSRPTSSLKPSDSPITTLQSQGGRATPSDKWKQGARRILLQWVQELIKRDSHRQPVSNFGSDWRDGNAFLSVINSIQPNTVNADALRSSTNRTRLETAFNVAEKELNIPKLLDPEDVDVPKPDEKSIMTYVAQFLNRQSNEPKFDYDLIHQYYDGLVTWLNQKIQFNEHMKQTGSLSKNYNDFLTMLRELDSKEEIYKKLKGYEGVVANLDFPFLHMLWDKLQLQIKEWQWRLDSYLPDPFNRIGQWVAKAELLVSSHDVPEVMNDEAARILNSKIEEHKQFFADLPRIQSEFNSALQLPVVNSVPTEQLQSLARRLDAIPPLALKRAIKLKFLEHKCCLVAFIQLIENRLKQWTIKYGQEDHAIFLLEQYNNFVNKNKIFQEFQRAYVDMEHVVQEYKADGGIDARESRAADHFLWEIAERWKNISMELRCVQSMLEEVISYWRRYHSIHGELENWIDRSIPMVQLPEDQRIEYFQDLASWADKYNTLQDTVSFLSATCDQPAVQEVKETFSRIAAKWSALYQQVKQYQFSGQILKLKAEFNKSLSELQAWIAKADDYLTRQPASAEDCRIISEVLQSLSQEIDQMDEKWRHVNKKFQTLLPELPGNEVDRIIQVIKKEKENLVRVRAQLPIRQNIIQQLLLQQEALQAGQDEINSWLMSASQVLSSYNETSLNSSAACQQLLDRHRLFFNKKLYYKTMLESKNKLLDNIVKAIRPEQRDQFNNAQTKMRQLNNEFNSVDQVSKETESRLQELVRCWKNFEENQKVVTDWMTTAEKLLNEPNLETKQSAQANKEYFERVNERPLKEMIKASQDLQRIIPMEEYANVSKTVLDIGSHWNDIISRVPVHLTKLEFRLDEEELAAILKDIDKEVATENVMLSKQENIQTILHRNQEYFTRGNVADKAKKCLDRLQQRKERFVFQHPEDTSLNEQYEQAKTAYDAVFERVSKLNVHLRDIPEQWDAYHKKFDQVSQWMDSVDNTLKSIMTDVSDIDTFEKEKARFLGICREVDQKRDDMKRLVQMLDVLISKSGVTSEEKYLEEQDKLESLISRYKNLVPTIEITMVKTEITSRCYTYREETERIVETLTKLKTQSNVDQPETLAQVEQQIKDYSSVLNTLETEQRPVIISLLQKGKDLQKEPNTLGFIPGQTVRLDETWTTTFNEINDKVKNLKSTQKTWADYEKQKADIIGLLDKAEDELKRILPGASSALEVTEDLKMKQSLNVELRKATEDTLRKLKDLCKKLEESSEKFKLSDEVAGIESRLLNLLDLLDQKINAIQTDNSKWKAVSDKINELRDWMLNTQKLLAQLLSMEIPPGERVKKINELQTEIREKMVLLEEIEKEAFGLGEIPGVDIATQVGDLKSTLVTLVESVGIQTQESVKALNAWKQCQDKLAEIQPWIEKAEVKVNIGFNPPASLPQAKSDLTEIKTFIEEAVLIKTTFESASSELETIGNVSSAQDDLDALQNKWTVINNTVTQWRDKLETLINNWTKHDSSVSEFQKWLSDTEKIVEKDFDASKADKMKLEERMNLLKELGAQCSSRQAKLIPITQELDAIIQHTSPEGSTTLSNSLTKLKERHGKLTENIRKKMIDISDESIQRQEREAKTANVLRWLDSLGNSIAQVESVYLTQLETSVQRINTLIDEQQSHGGEVQDISPGPSAEQTDVINKLKNFQEQLEAKKQTLTDWVEIHNWVKEADSSTQHINRQLLVTTIDQPELTRMSEEVTILLTQCSQMVPKAKAVDAKSEQAKVTVRNPTTLSSVTATELVNDVNQKLVTVNKKINEKIETQKKIGSQAQQIKEIQVDIKQHIATLTNAIQDVKPEKADVQSVGDVKQQLVTLLQEHEKKQPKKAELAKLCRELMSTEPGNIAPMSEVVQSVEAEWDKISDLMKQKLQNCDAVQASVAQLSEDQAKVQQALTAIKNDLDKSLSGPIPQDSVQTAAVLSKLKKVENSLVAQKPQLDTLASAGKQLLSRVESIAPSAALPVETETAALIAQYDTIKDKLASAIPKLETQVVLWKSIEGSRDLILSWLTATKAALQGAGNDTNALRSQLDLYKDQVGEKHNLKLNLDAKAKQLRALTSKDIPQLATLGQDLAIKFQELADLSKALEVSLESRQDKEKEIKANLKVNSDRITKVKEMITRCEDRTGTPIEIYNRLEALSKAQVEFNGLKPDFEQTEAKIVQFKTENPEWDDSHIQNLVKSNKKRVSILRGQLETVRTSLTSALEKNYLDKLHPTGKIVAGLVEKIKLCDVQSITDNYTLQAKQAALKDIQEGVLDVRAKIPTIEESLAVLQRIEDYPKVNECASEFSKLINDLDFVEKNAEILNGKLSQLALLWGRFEGLGEGIQAGIKDVEGKVKAELSKPVDLQRIDQKLAEVQALSTDVEAFKDSISELQNLNQEILKLAPEFHTGQIVSTAMNKLQAINKSLTGQKGRLAELKDSAGRYKDALKNAQEWIVQSEAKLDAIETKLNTKAGKDIQPEDIKDLVDSKDGQDLINQVLELGQVILPGITSESKDTIRTEIKALRSKWEDFFDKGNSLIKKLENIKIALSSFEETTNQINGWLKDIQARTTELAEPKATLGDKKIALQNQKLLIGDIKSHLDIIDNLKDKMKEYDSTVDKLDGFANQYATIQNTLMAQIAKTEAAINEQEKLNEMADQFRDFIHKVRDEVGPLSNAVIENPDELKKMKERLDDNSSLGDAKLAQLEKQLAAVLQSTHPDGHDHVKMGVKVLKSEWNSVIAEFGDAVANLEKVSSQNEEFNKQIEDFTSWLKGKEIQAKDSSFKSTVEAKTTHLKKLEDLLREIQSRENDLTELTDQARGIGNDELEAKLVDLNTRYQTVRPLIQDSITRCKGYVQDHSKFNADHAELLGWIQDMQNKSKDIGDVLGDAGELQEKKATLIALMESRSRKSPELEAVIDAGEKLYSHTSPDGREIIRQQIKLLRDGWDSLSDNLQQTHQKLDSCITQFNNFSTSQEELTKWLRGIEASMQIHTQLKGTIQEKNAQLQNHKIVNQEIISHQILVESLCEKSQQLIDLTKDKSLEGYVKSIKQLFQSIKDKSSDLLVKLENCIADHNKLNNLLKEYKDTLNRNGDALAALADDEAGEKADILRKLEEAKGLQADLAKNSALAEKVDDMFSVVKQTTNDAGIHSIQAEINGLLEIQDGYQESVENLIEKFSSILKSWADFESGLQQNAQFFRNQETFFRSQPLQDTLPHKQDTLELLSKERQKVIDYEQEFNLFLEQSHNLLRQSNAEKIRQLLVQINNRYQLLLVLTKEVVNRWQSLADDHAIFNQKYLEACQSLQTLEDSFKPIQAETISDINERNNLLKNLSLEKQQLGQNINLLFPMAEKIYPDTLASGREVIRQDMRNLRDRFDALDENVNAQVKKLASESQQLVNYNETIQQTLAWLDNMEKSSALDQEPNWMSVPEIRSKLIKCKAVLQDVISYKRVIENIVDKANELVARNPGQNFGDLPQVTEAIKARYEGLTNNLLVGITNLEETLDYVQQWQDQLKKGNDWVKNMREILTPLADSSGGKMVLNDRLRKIDDLKGSLGEGQSILGGLELILQKESKATPAKVKEYFKKDLLTLKFDYDKLIADVDEARHAIQEQLSHWSEFEDRFDRLNNWLEEAEDVLRSYGNCNTIEEKEEQRDKYNDFAKIVDSRGKEVQDFLYLADSVQQKLIQSLKEKEPDFVKLSNDLTDLTQQQPSGETRMSSNVQQIMSRFESTQLTAKEILKKAAQAYEDHLAHNKNRDKFIEQLTLLQATADSVKQAAPHSELPAKLNEIRDMIATQQPMMTANLNNLIESCEKLYPTTGNEGKEIIRNEIQDLAATLEAIFDSLNNAETEIKTQLSRWSNFEESKQLLEEWFAKAEPLLAGDIELKVTLDEKRAQLNKYRNTLKEILEHQQIIMDLVDKVTYLPENQGSEKKLAEDYKNRHAALLEKCQGFVEQYEGFVCNHRQYLKAVEDFTEWVEGTQSAVITWGDDSQERTILQAHLERLKNLKSSLPEETYRIEDIRTLGSKVIPGTLETGQDNIRSQIDASQQEWEGLLSSIESSINALQQKLALWTSFEAEKDKFMAWLKETDSKLHAIDLQPTLEDKIQQLHNLHVIQGEVKSRELEVDSISDRALSIQKQGLPLKSSSASVSELTSKYQQISSKTKELVQKWQDYVNSHQDFDVKIQETASWLDDISDKLAQCADFNISGQQDLEGKLASVHELLLCKEEGFNKIQAMFEHAQTILSNTAPSGHQAINNKLKELQDKWNTSVSKMIETKNQLDQNIHRWAGFLEQIHQLNKTLEYVEATLEENAPFLATLPEKKSQLEVIKNLEEKLSNESYDVDMLKTKAQEMINSGQQTQAASQALETLKKFETLTHLTSNLRQERESQFKDHRQYIEAHEELAAWLQRTREKIPMLAQSSGRLFDVENANSVFNNLLNKKTQGTLLVERLGQAGDLVLASTSSQGKAQIQSEIKELTDSFNLLFAQIQQERDSLEDTMSLLREWKEEHERLSDWLQQCDIIIKAAKITFMGTIEEKRKQVRDVDEIVEKLNKGKADMDKFNKMAEPLVAKSYLDSHVGTILNGMNSRYETQVKTATDILSKVRGNLECHEEFVKTHKKAKDWMEEAKNVIADCAQSPSDNKGRLQTNLALIQDLVQRQEQGQKLIHLTVNLGERALRTTRSDGRDAINDQIKEIQAEWDRLVKKISNTKVAMETSLLRWADYDSSYTQVQKWISDREAKLAEVTEQKKPKKGILKNAKPIPGMSSVAIGDRKANLRVTNTIVQDIVSLEPMIESVTSKAENLQQDTPASEISTKYQSLNKKAQELYAKQKESVELHQAFADLASDLMSWIRLQKEKLVKISEPVGDKETLSNKISQLKVLQNELPEGQSKLEAALSKAKDACNIVDEDDKELIEQEAAILQEEFDNYADTLTKTQQQLETGLVRWKEWEEQHKDAEEWLAKTENEVKQFHQSQNTLEEKRIALETFQVKLQAIFDWQKELDKLNLLAQQLLDICADSRISNTVTQMTTKFNALLGVTKELIRRLELQYQEHQQHNALYQECQDWIDRTRDKLTQLNADTSYSLPDLQARLQSVKGMKQTIEQGQNKLRYVLELKDKIVLSSDKEGASKINEDTEALKNDFDKLVADIQEARQKLTARYAIVEEIEKLHNQIVDWLNEITGTIESTDANDFGDLSEKRAHLEKLKSLVQEVSIQGEMLSKLDAKIKDVPGMPRETYEPTFERYEQLKAKLSDGVAKMEQVLRDHENYKKQYIETCDHIRKIRIDLQPFSDATGEKEALNSKLSALNAMTPALENGDALVKKTREMGAKAVETCSAEGKDTIQQELQQLGLEWDSIQNFFKDCQKKLKKSISSWDDFEKISAQCKATIQDLSARIAAEPETENATPEDLERVKDLLGEVHSHKYAMEDLNEKCEQLIEDCGATSVRDDTIALQSLYTALVANAQALQSRTQKKLADHTEFLKAKKDIEEWLSRAEGTVQDCSGLADEPVMRENLETIESVATRQTEGQHLLNLLQDAFTRLINAVPIEQQDAMRNDVEVIRARWEDFNLTIKNSISKLKEILQRWNNFNEQCKQFDTWADNMLENLNGAQAACKDLATIKTTNERLKSLQNEIETEKLQLEKLQTEAESLASISQNGTPNQTVADLQKKWDELNAVVVKLRTELENEIRSYTQYNDQLQEIEKWLLHISFQLMAHNSLYITNREQTLEQLEVHEQLLEEIKNYKSVLDNIQTKGQEQIKKYGDEVKPNVEKQLKNVLESYDSLLHTGVQIKNRLLESLAKFQQYEDTLVSIMANLDEWEPQISAGVSIPLESIEVATKKLDDIRKMHNMLQGEKTRLSLAVHACEAATASLSRPTSPQEALLQPIPDNELAVRSRLEDCIDQVQTQMSDLSSAVQSLEKLKESKDALIQWADDTLSALREIKNRPSKFRPDTSQIEMNQLQDIRSTAGDKLLNLDELEIEESGIVQTVYLPDLRPKLESIDSEVQNVVETRMQLQDKITEHKNLLTAVENWLGSLSGRVEKLEKPSQFSIAEKLEKIQEIADEFQAENQPKFNEVKKSRSDIIKETNNIDTQIIEDQVNGLERKMGEFAKRLERKQQILEQVNKNLEDFNHDLAQINDYIKEKDKDYTVHMGYEIQPIENILATVKGVLRELDSKEIIVSTLERRLGTLQPELEDVQTSQAQKELQATTNALEGLKERLKGQLGALKDGIKIRRKFHDTIDNTNSWVNRMFKELILSSTTPLASSKVQLLLNSVEKLSGQIKDRLESTEIRTDYDKLRKDCDDTEGQKLDDLIRAIEQSLTDLSSTAQLQKENLLGVYSQRKGFEEDFERCENWIKECETSLGSDLKGSANINVLQEQIKKFKKVESDIQEIRALINELNEEGKKMMPSLNEPDCQILSDQLSSLSTKVNALAQNNTERLNQLNSAIKELEQTSNIIAESRAYLEKVKKRVDELNKPLGNNYDETQEVLGTFENLLEELKAHRKNLDSDEYQALRSSSDFRDVLKDEDALIFTIEGIITRLRHLVLLQQQYSALVTEIQNFLTNYTDVVADIQKSGGSNEDNIKLYDDVLAKIQHNEAQLATAADKGDRISDEGTIADRNAITEQLQELKQGLNELRKVVETKRQENQEAIAEYLKYSEELDDIMSWLHDNEVTIKSRPILEKSTASVDAEIRKHETLAQGVAEKLSDVTAIEESLPSDGLPSSLADKLSEARLLAKVLPQELADRLSYLEKNKSLRQQHEKLVSNLAKWVAEAQDRLKETEPGINFEKAGSDLSEHKAYFSIEKAILQQLANAKQLVDSMWPCVTPQDQELISKEHEDLTESIQNTFNSAKSRTAELDRASNLWKAYIDLLGIVNNAIARAEEPQEPGANLGALKYNLTNTKEAIKTLQSQQNEYENLKERASTILGQADKQCKAKIQTQMSDLEKRWNKALKTLEDRRESIIRLVSNWEHCEVLWQKFESGLASIEDHFSQIDPTIRSHQQLNETRAALESILNECNELEPVHKDLLESAGHILEHLKTASDISYSSLNGKLNHLSEQYRTIIELVMEKLKWLNGQDTYLTQLDSKLEDYGKTLAEIETRLNAIRPCDPDEDGVLSAIKSVDDQIEDIKKSIHEFNTGLKDRFTALKQILPSSLVDNISSLELKIETLSSNSNDKMKEFRRIQGIRGDFRKNVKEIKAWIQTTEKSLVETEAAEPAQLKQNIQTLMTELPKIQDQMETVEKLGKNIVDTTPNDTERQDVRNEIETLQTQINEIRRTIEERNYKIGESLDSWQKFLQLYAQVMAWGAEKKEFLQEPLQLSSLPEARLKLNNYTMAVKSLKHVGKQLSEMGRELDRIAEVSNVGPLHGKLDEAEQMKVAVEAELLERHALLQETTEEWEQCEKKLYEAKIWLEKTKQSLEQQAGKRKPLRDQLAAKEILLADVAVQKTKIGLSIEKLQVHFKAGIGGDPNIAVEESELQAKLDSMGEEIKVHCSALEAAVAQIDRLQEEIQVLRSQLSSAEQKLRHVCSPSYLSQDRERAAMEQTAWREKLKVIQSKITARNERIKLLMLLGTPSPDPLH